VNSVSRRNSWESRGLLRQRVSVSAKYELVDAEKRTLDANGERKHTVTRMCQWLEVSTSGYYEWRGRPESATGQRRERLKELIKEVVDDSDETYGRGASTPRWSARASTARSSWPRGLMRELGLVPCQPRPWRTAGRDAAACPPEPAACRDARRCRNDPRLICERSRDSRRQRGAPSCASTICDPDTRI
jgi:hypothetical protein